MTFKESIEKDFKEAMKNKDHLTLGVLRLLQAAIKNKELEKRKKLSKENMESQDLESKSQLEDKEILEVIISETKKRKESIEQFEKAGRLDLSEQEKKELEILKKYLPEQMSEEEIRKLVKETIEKLGASAPQDTGKIMADLMPQLKGKADGGLVSKIVQEELRNNKNGQPIKPI